MSTMFAINVTHYYYAGTFNAPKSGLIRNTDGEVLTFASYDAAHRYMRLLEPNENSRLNHGEYSPRVYRVRKYSR